mmetsp:Transcript_34430/g.87017  ORF Transcript_34430/g.87017 Transcript_34430/m.87017 type:complete len:208 (-) Transcript_34430:146-769(-)
MSHPMTFPNAFRYAPLWCVTTPLGSPVVPDVYPRAMASHSSGGPSISKEASPSLRKASYSTEPMGVFGVPSGASESITSITKTSLSTVFRASDIVAANSLSTTTTLASEWWRMKPIDAGSSLVLSALITAPAMGMPQCASSISGVLLSMTATVSPRCTPLPIRALASCLLLRAVSLHVNDLFPCTHDTLRGYVRSTRFRRDKGESSV